MIYRDKQADRNAAELLLKGRHKNPYAGVALAYVGSHSFGTATDDTDDVDLMHVRMPSADSVLGLGHWEKPVVVQEGEYDVVSYELRHLVSLWLKGNPNVLGLLWMPQEHYVFLGSDVMIFREIRSAFAAKSCARPYYGYAQSQLRDMERGVYKGYMGAKRKENVERFGYDTKHASHLIRILRMACEFQSSGEMFVDRSHIDAHILRDIKQGRWSKEKVLAEASMMFEHLKLLEATSSLPDEPDRELVERHLMRVMRNWVC